MRSNKTIDIDTYLPSVKLLDIDTTKAKNTRHNTIIAKGVIDEISPTIYLATITSLI